MTKLLMFLLSICLFTSISFAADLSSSSVAARISVEGGQKVLRDLWQHEEAFAPVLTGIESGDPSWLNIATQLKPYADGAASLSLNYAVARALPKAPEAVLALVGKGFDIDRICTLPFIEPDPGVAELYERQTLAALSSVIDPSLKPLATRCSKLVQLPAGA